MSDPFTYLLFERQNLNSYFKIQWTNCIFIYLFKYLKLKYRKQSHILLISCFCFAFTPILSLLPFLSSPRKQLGRSFNYAKLQNMQYYFVICIKLQACSFLILMFTQHCGYGRYTHGSLLICSLLLIKAVEYSVVLQIIKKKILILEDDSVSSYFSYKTQL